MSTRNQSLGRWGEQQAASYLEERGYQILARNQRTEHGEIDLIAQHGETIVFVEVKARSSRAFGYPEEAVTPAKQQHLLDSAQIYLIENELNGDWRVDVIAVSRQESGPPEIEHFEHALR